MISPAVGLSGRTFESTFRPGDVSRKGAPRYKIEGSGWDSHSRNTANTDAVIQMLKDNGFVVNERSMGSPGNLNSYHREVEFMDGGLHICSGNYWCREKGAWIVGEQAVAWVARMLGVKPPYALRRKLPSRLEKKLLTSYAATDYVVLGEPEHHIRVGERISSDLTKLLQDAHVDSAVLITASNPFSVQFHEDINHLRQCCLEQDLAKLGCLAIPAQGRDPAGEWPPEDSMLAFGVSDERIESLLVDYQQHASVLIMQNAEARLVLHPTKTFPS